MLNESSYVLSIKHLSLLYLLNGLAAAIASFDFLSVEFDSDTPSWNRREGGGAQLFKKKFHKGWLALSLSVFIIKHSNKDNVVLAQVNLNRLKKQK